MSSRFIGVMLRGGSWHDASALAPMRTATGGGSALTAVRGKGRRELRPRAGKN
ncbi:MAG TPA: hypothetical protein VK391_02705 [Allosphingosinicella sp.]|nr:hypothetical protein [Allosphingosinicella sp.]